MSIVDCRLLAGTRGTFIRISDADAPPQAQSTKASADAFASSKFGALSQRSLGPPLLGSLEGEPSLVSGSMDATLHASTSSIELHRSHSTIDAHRSALLIDNKEFVFAGDSLPDKDTNFYIGMPAKQKYSIDTGVWTRAPGRL